MNASSKTPRDCARSIEAYDAMLTGSEASSNKMKSRREDETDQIKRDSMRNIVFMNHLKVARVLYCRGDALAEIRAPVEKAIAAVIPVEGGDIVKAVYVDMLDFASLAVLLKMPESTFRGLKEIADYCDGRDQVLDHLISYGTKYKKGEAGESALMKMTNLNLALNCCTQAKDKSECAKFLLDFLDTEWHERQVNGFDLKNRSNPELPYRGIYCFKVAAIAYINDLDDTKLRQSEYYPTDLADYVRTRN